MLVFVWMDMTLTSNSLNQTESELVAITLAPDYLTRTSLHTFFQLLTTQSFVLNIVRLGDPVSVTGGWGEGFAGRGRDTSKSSIMKFESSHHLLIYSTSSSSSPSLPLVRSPRRVFITYGMAPKHHFSTVDRCWLI